MKKLFAISAGLTLAVSLAPAPAQAASPFRIEVRGPAVIDSTNPRPSTTIRFPVTVRCPAGETRYYGFAGTPGYFPGNPHPQPWFYSNSYPGKITCTGRNQTVQWVAQSTERFATPPYQVFTPGWITVVVTLGISSGPVSDTKRIRILPEQATPE